MKRLSQAIGNGITDSKLEVYWKDKGLRIADFFTQIRAANVQEAMFHALQTASCVFHRWTVGGPQQYSGDRWEFSGYSSDGPIIVGVEAAEFHVFNFDPRRTVATPMATGGKESK